jgi:drug/metabolite transporter (DMT)-like permease
MAEAALVTAESILALTPVIIKKTPLDPLSAIWSRLLSSAVLGYGLAGDRRIGTREIGGSLALGYTNLVHVASSYESFRHLPAGQAMSILYTYPLWNLLFVAYFNNEKITGREYSLVGIAAIGSILLNMNPGTATPAVAGANGKVNPVWGVFMALLMALTESGMHTILRIMKWTDPAKAVWIVNTSASLWLGGAMAVQQLVFGVEQQAWTGTWWDQLLLTGFNSLSIFTGYWLRYYAVPRLSSSVYSMLSYAGLLASYLFGLAFLGEVPGWQSVLGALIIVGAGLALQIEQEPK